MYPRRIRTGFVHRAGYRPGVSRHFTAKGTSTRVTRRSWSVCCIFVQASLVTCRIYVYASQGALFVDYLGMLSVLQLVPLRDWLASVIWMLS